MIAAPFTPCTMGNPISLDTFHAFRLKLCTDTVPRLEICSYGALAWVFVVTQDIVVKIPHEPESEGFKTELQAYKQFQSHLPCPSIANAFLSIPTKALFLPYFRGGTLEKRMWSHQVWDKTPHNVLEVTGHEPDHLIERWLSQLCDGVVWLENLGYVHGDLTPHNLVLDHEDNLKLIDFERISEIGVRSDGDRAPWARLLGSDEIPGQGAYGRYGVKTEQFTIGSILYFMKRGHEPYALDHLDAHDYTDRFRDKQFPDLNDSTLDKIIRRCWWTDYTSLKELRDEAAALKGALNSPPASAVAFPDMQSCRAQCEQLVKQGLLQEKETSQ